MAAFRVRFRFAYGVSCRARASCATAHSGTDSPLRPKTASGSPADRPRRTTARLNGARVYGSAAVQSQGRGSLPSVARSARALTDRPISVNSAAACTIVETTPSRRMGAGWGRNPVAAERVAAVLRGRGGAPPGCFGCGSVCARLGAARAGRFGAASGGCSAGDGGGSTARRLPLRRCGRVCGSEPRISDWRFSLIAPT